MCVCACVSSFFHISSPVKSHQTTSPQICWNRCRDAPLAALHLRSLARPFAPNPCLSGSVSNSGEPQELDGTSMANPIEKWMSWGYPNLKGYLEFVPWHNIDF